jgi:hypothetical protein
MSQAIFNAIAFQDLETLEQRLESGDSPTSPNEKGTPPLGLVASLIKKSFEEGEYDKEDLYKKMAAVLIAHGAHDSDLQHACGEVSNLGRHLCHYVIDHALDQQESGSVSKMIEAKRLWFSDDNAEGTLLDAIARGDRSAVDALFENDRVHFAYEQ